MIFELSEASAVSGREKEVADIVLDSLRNENFDIKKDKIGNVIAECITKKDNPTIAILSHMDECGLIVTDITEDGYLKFDTIGKVDVNSLLSQRVRSEKSPITYGVISLKAVHLTTKEEREKPLSVDKLYIDIGAVDKKEASLYVTKGDCFVFATKCEKFGSDSVKGKALSRAVSTSVLIDVINNHNNNNINLICVFAAQNNIYQRGIKTSLNSIGDVNFAVKIDCFDCSEKSKSDTTVGKGTVISSTLCNICEVLSDVEDCQYRYDDTDSNIDVLRNYLIDTPVAEISVPCNHRNTPVNTIRVSDVKSLSRVLNKLIAEVSNGNISSKRQHN